MYDDGHVYTDKPGNVNWKFAGGPKAELDASIAAKKAKAAGPATPALMQKSAKDSYDHDPTTTSMYDDGHVYTDKPGNVNWKFAGGPKAELDASIAAKKAKAAAPAAAAPALVQKSGKDSFDADGSTASMYDDQHVYSKPGQFTGGAAKLSGKPEDPTKDAAAPGNPEAALSQKKSKDTFDVDDKQHALDPQDSSMYDDQHTYTAKPGSLKNTPYKGTLIQSTDKVSVDAQLDEAAKNWLKSKSAKDEDKPAPTAPFAPAVINQEAPKTETVKAKDVSVGDAVNGTKNVVVNATVAT